MDFVDESAMRIAWRADLMSLQGGTAYLTTVACLFGHREPLLGPRHVGLPLDLQRGMYAKGW